jgi:hypothetical protein
MLAARASKDSAMSLWVDLPISSSTGVLMGLTFS